MHVHGAGRPLTSEQFRALFAYLGELLEDNDMNMDILLCGGVLMVFDGLRETTDDADGIADRMGAFLTLRKDVAQEFKINEDWLNNDVEDIFKLRRVPKSSACAKIGVGLF